MTTKVLLCGGATAGHIEPALNVAKELVSLGASCEFVGTVRGLDRQLISAANFPLHLINPVPLPRTINFDLLLLPFRMTAAVIQSVKICKKLRPDVVIGFGSFVALPTYLAARFLRIPLVIHEANSKPGIANKIGARLAQVVFQTVENSIQGAKTVGTPLRSVYDEFDRATLRARGIAEFGLDSTLRTLLVFGGSQGARHINEVVNEISERLTNDPLQILHVVGRNNTDQILNRSHHHYREYVLDMSLAYAVADLAICRSGALSVAEIAATNTPAIFVPFPIGNGEQEKNAKERIDIGAASMVLDRDLNGITLLREVETSLINLTTMQQCGASHTPINATQTIAKAAIALTQA